MLRVPSGRDLRTRWVQFRADVGLWREKRAYYRKGGVCERPRAAFVVGSQRSGTDMVLWTLDKSLDVWRYDENSRAAFRDCRIKERGVRERLIRSSRAKRVIFKPVCDSHRVSSLLGEHEDSRAIWVYRDFRDVANSAVQRWGDMNLRWMREVGGGGGDWGRKQWNRELITAERAAQIREWCRAELNSHEAAAIFWYMVNQTFFSQELGVDSRVGLARYERLVGDPAPEFRRLCRFLGIGYREEMAAGIFQSSVKRRSDAPIGAAIADACESLAAELDAALARHDG